ncbi:fumarylacetoacetase [Phenylobacterium sp.]|jgi:fumarylacetoacetase|uniref:fumarylacetoacetase n=1 Tax=Phenylobacterium sp. TaxID=1871053 RepID=UPI002F945C7C
MAQLNGTHEAGRRSWIEAANGDTDFPLQNLPHGVFSRGGARRGGVAIGDMILDMAAALDAGLFRAELLDVARAAAAPELNSLLESAPDAVAALRVRIQQLLEKGAPEQGRVSELLVPMSEAELHLPARIGAFTDFMTSAPHIAGSRPARPEGGKLPPCFWSLPIAYNSRASSVVVSGTPLERPHGQYPVEGEARFGPTRSLDFELEFACVIGPGNRLSQPIRLDDARAHIFGYCLLNDWSARDFQWWESVLGPFQAKAFRTTVSPWIVTAEAMAPFRKPLPPRPGDAPRPPVHLHSAANDAEGGLAIRFEAHLLTSAMREAGAKPFRLTDTSFDAGSWSFEQMVTHHAIGGCNLEPGDLLSSGTLSDEALESAGCLVERTGGRVPVELANGETRLWLEDGDELVITGRAEREGFRPIGFGPCAGRVIPAVAFTPAA